MILGQNQAQAPILKIATLCLAGLMTLAVTTNANTTGEINIKNYTECSVTPLLDGFSHKQVSFKSEYDSTLLVNFEEKTASLGSTIASHQYTIPVSITCDKIKYTNQILISLQPTFAKLSIEATHHFTPAQLVISGDDIMNSTNSLVTVLVLPQKLTG